jgi:uncharacterized protein
MEFDWDDEKSDKNLAERGFGFDFAAAIFAGRTLSRPDNRKDYGEDRFVAIGEWDDVVLAVVYTDRDGLRRIISARTASRKERKLWRA